MLIAFSVQFETAAVKSRFNSAELHVKNFSEWVMTAVVSAPKDIIESMKVRDFWRKSAENASQFLKLRPWRPTSSRARRFGRF